MIELVKQNIGDAFIGLHLNNDDQFEWTDGTVADYFAWSDGEPNNYWQLEGCGVMFSGSGHWNDAYCSRPKNGYVCKKIGGSDYTTPKPTEMPEGHCPSDQFENKGYCFKFYGLAGDSNEHMNWTDARAQCRSLGYSYDLASIHSAQEQAFVTSVLADHDIGSDSETAYEFWIGFIDFVHWEVGTDGGTFVWSDQSSVEYTNWAVNEPNGNYEIENICVEMYAHDDYDIGHWNDLNCERVLPFICRGSASMDNAEPPVTPKCKDQFSDFDSFEGNCYKWMEEPTAWLEAEQLCQEMGGAHLVSILSEAEQAFSYITTKGAASWLGLSDSSYNGLFRWSDGWPMQISNWGHTPTHGELSTCGLFNVTDGKWYGSDCEQKLPFICKYSEAVPPSPPPNGECPLSSFQDLDPNSFDCYMFETEAVVSWNDANRACTSMGSGSILASIHSQEEMDKISGELAKTQTSVWIGLFTTVDHNLIDYFWSDNSAVDFTNWEEGEPNDSTGTELCVEAYGHNGKWNDASCEPYYGEGKGYICKMPKSKNIHSLFLFRSFS